MAFTGTAVVTLISDKEAVITGLSLAAGAAGTIGFAGGLGEIDLPQQFKVQAFKGPSGQTITPALSVDVSVKPAAIGVATAIPVTVGKAGANQAGFLATLTNTHATLATPNLEIYVKNIT